MNDIRETVINHVAGEDYATICTEERKWINQIYKLKDSHYDEVNIKYVNEDGSIIAHIPVSWVKIRPKKKVNLTAEQIAEQRARLEQGRKRRVENYGGSDAYVGADNKEDWDGKET